MKTLTRAGIVFITVFGLTAGCLAQSEARVYLDGNYAVQETEALARYSREARMLEDGSYEVTIYYIDGTKKMIGSYNDHKFSEPHGYFEYFYRNGQRESAGEYCSGRKCGVWKRWAWDGGERADRVYPDRQQKKVITEPAQFPGGYQALTSFIQKHTIYPKAALEKNITGIVKIAFRIDEGGLVRDVEVVERSASMISQAALECIWNMPLWEPATKNGREVASTFILPLIFTIEDGEGKVTIGN